MVCYITYLLSVMYRGIILSPLVLQRLFDMSLVTEILLQNPLNIWSSICHTKGDLQVDLEVAATRSDELTAHETKKQRLKKLS